MRVAIIITRPVLLGPSILMRSVANTLSVRENLTVELYFLEKPKKNEPAFDYEGKLFRRRTFRFEDYDIIHTSGIRPDLTGFLYRKRIKCHISTIHSLVSEEFLLTRNRLFSFIFGNIWLFIWRSADKLVCVSETARRYYSDKFSQTKLTAIHNGIGEKVDYGDYDNDLISEINQFRDKGLKIIGTAAILTRLKNTHILIRLLTLKPVYALVVIGRGNDLGNLTKLAIDLGVADRCLFTGFRKDASKYFSFFDLFVSASLSEGFGLSVLEAVRERVPVVCSSIPVFMELFTPEEVTFFDPFDVNSLSVAIDAASEKGKDKTNAACSTFKTKYDEKLMGLRYYELYRSVCKNDLE